MTDVRVCQRGEDLRPTDVVEVVFNKNQVQIDVFFFRGEGLSGFIWDLK